jgi:hypothetical protein
MRIDIGEEQFHKEFAKAGNNRASSRTVIEAAGNRENSSIVKACCRTSCS